MSKLRNRLERLEAMEPAEDLGMPFLWGTGLPLADALNDAGLTLDDKPLLAIRLVGIPARRSRGLIRSTSGICICWIELLSRLVSRTACHASVRILLRQLADHT